MNKKEKAYSLLILVVLNYSAVMAAASGGDIISTGRILQETADSLFLAGNLPQAKQYYYQALNLYDKAADTLGISFCKLGIAKLSCFEGYFSKAQKLLAGVDSLFIEKGLWLPAFECRRMMGDIYAKRGQYEEAVWHYRSAADIGKLTEDKSLYCAGLRLLGKLALQRRSFHGAVIAFHQALQNAPAASDSGYAYIGLGDAQVINDDLHLSLTFLDSAQTMAVTSADSALWADVYGAKAQTYRKMSNYHRSLDYYGKQLDIIKTRRDQLSRAKTMMNMAAIFEMQKQYAKAADFMQEVVLIFEQLNSPETEIAKEFLSRLKKAKK